MVELFLRKDLRKMKQTYNSSVHKIQAHPLSFFEFGIRCVATTKRKEIKLLFKSFLNGSAKSEWKSHSLRRPKSLLCDSDDKL